MSRVAEGGFLFGCTSHGASRMLDLYVLGDVFRWVSLGLKRRLTWRSPGPCQRLARIATDASQAELWVVSVYTC